MRRAIIEALNKKENNISTKKKDRRSAETSRRAAAQRLGIEIILINSTGDKDELLRRGRRKRWLEQEGPKAAGGRNSTASRTPP